MQRALENREAGSTLKQQAVLFRTSHHCGPLEVELTRRNIPFVKFGGLKFLDAAHIRDMLALLRFVENPRDGMAGFRLMQLIPGVGPVSAQEVLDHMIAAADPIAALLDAPSPPRAADDWGAFVDTVTHPRAGGRQWPAELELARLWYEPHLERIYEDAITRRADLIQLEHIASGYPSRERFLTELTLDPPEATSDQSGVPLLDEDYLILSTIHSAKGQEWKSVFVLNVVDGCIPSDLGAGTTAEIEEERRLLYVALTRARDDLHLMVPQRFFTHGQNAQGDHHVYASRSRFIPVELLGFFKRTAWPEAAPELAARGIEGSQTRRWRELDAVLSGRVVLGCRSQGSGSHPRLPEDIAAMRKKVAPSGTGSLGGAEPACKIPLGIGVCRRRASLSHSRFGQTSEL